MAVIAPEIKAPAKARAIRQIRWTPFNVVVTVVALTAAALALYPLIRVFLAFFIVDGRVDLSAFGAVFEVRNLGQLIINTVSIVLVSGLISLVVGALLAWLNERTNAKLGSFGQAMPILPFLIPPIASGIGWLLLFQPDVGIGNAFLRWLLGLVGIHIESGPFNVTSWWGLVIVLAIVHVPYSYMLISAGLRNMDGALEEQSRVCGAGAFTTLRKITLPGVRNAIASAVLLLVFFGFADYSIPVVIGTAANIDVIAVEVVKMMTDTYPPQIGAAISLSLVGMIFVVVVWLIQRRLIQSKHFFSIGGKAQSSALVNLRGWKWLGRTFSIGFIIISSVLPLVSLAIVALTGYWSATVEISKFSFDTFRQVLIDDSSSIDAMRNSLILALVGATLGVIIAALSIEFVSRSNSRFRTAIDGIIKAPATFSIIIVTIGIILGFSGPPFYLGATLAILLIGYLVIYMPQATVNIESSVAQVGGELREASAISGSSVFGTYRRVVLPLVVPGLVAGWALLFVRMFSDLTASVMLAGPSTPVIGFRILNIYQNGSFGTLAALTLVVTLIASVTVITLLALSSRANRKWRGTAKRSIVSTAEASTRNSEGTSQS